MAKPSNKSPLSVSGGLRSLAQLLPELELEWDQALGLAQRNGLNLFCLGSRLRDAPLFAWTRDGVAMEAPAEYFEFARVDDLLHPHDWRELSSDTATVSALNFTLLPCSNLHSGTQKIQASVYGAGFLLSRADLWVMPEELPAPQPQLLEGSRESFRVMLAGFARHLAKTEDEGTFGTEVEPNAKAIAEDVAPLTDGLIAAAYLEKQINAGLKLLESGNTTTRRKRGRKPKEGTSG